MKSVAIVDIETVHVDVISGAMSETLADGQFPKLVLHGIVCIGVLLVDVTEDGVTVRGLAAPTLDDMSEAELIAWLSWALERTRADVVTFNGKSFDFPVLRYRAMANGLYCPGLSQRRYFHRYTDDHVDLCDVLSSYSGSGKISLDLLSKGLALPGKPDDMDGSKVEQLYKDGKLDSISAYCKTDLMNTFRIWLRYERFLGRIDAIDLCGAEQSLAKYETH